MANVVFLGARLMAGLQILDLPVEVRILCPQPNPLERAGSFLTEVLTPTGGVILCPQPYAQSKE